MTNDLRIADAPLLVDVSGEEKLPTGGYGNYSTTINQIADFTQLKWKLATEGYVNNEINVVTNKLNNHTQDKKNPHEVTKEQVGLGEVDNTADLDKPVSAYQRTAIDEKIAKTSIVDNLTTNDSTKVLSAKQGKILQDTKANKADVNESLGLKADRSEVYTKDEVYSKDEVYNKDETLTLEHEDQYVVTESGRTQRELNKSINLSIDNINTRNTFVSIKHYRKNGFIYDVITGIQPHQLLMRDNQVGDSKLFTRCTVKEAAIKFNKPIALNALPFKNPDNSWGGNEPQIIPDGIYIRDGEVITGWEDAINPARNRAMCIMRDGALRRYFSDTTPQQMVADGAVYGMSWGVWYKYNGEVIPLTDDGVSGRNVIFQRDDGSLGFILIEGVTGQYGAAYSGVQSIIEAIGGIKSAWNLDGGGSAQCWWGNTYAMPSSDTSSRTAGVFFLVNTSSVLPYDSGYIPVPVDKTLATDSDSVVTSKPPLYLRQQGNEVTLFLNINKPLGSGLVRLTEGASVPARYRAIDASQTRAFLLGGGGNHFNVVGGGGQALGTFSASNFNSETPATSIIGNMRWFKENL